MPFERTPGACVSRGSLARPRRVVHPREAAVVAVGPGQHFPNGCQDVRPRFQSLPGVRPPDRVPASPLLEYSRRCDTIVSIDPFATDDHARGDRKDHAEEPQGHAIVGGSRRPAGWSRFGPAQAISSPISSRRRKRTRDLALRTPLGVIPSSAATSAGERSSTATRQNASQVWTSNSSRTRPRAR